MYKEFVTLNIISDRISQIFVNGCFIVIHEATNNHLNIIDK